VLMLNAIARGCPAAFACYLLFVPPAAGETLPDTIDDGLVQAARPGSLTSPILATILAINERPDLVSAIVERSVAVSPENAADIASAAARAFPTFAAEIVIASRRGALERLAAIDSATSDLPDIAPAPDVEPPGAKDWTT